MENAWAENSLICPDKQLERKHWAHLNGEWEFVFDPEERWEQPRDVNDWGLRIQVPFSPESKASGIGDTVYHPRCWYRRKFTIQRVPNHRVILRFGAVDYVAHVWVNGVFLGMHQGGYTPFCFDISHALHDEGDQEIVVRADDDPEDLAKPRGKQDWRLEPHSIWYPRTSGIWQTVWIEQVPHVYIQRLRLLPHLERWEIGFEAFIAGSHCGNLGIRVVLSNGQTIIAEDTYRVICREVHRRIALSDPGVDDYRNELLWRPERPSLIDVKVELLGPGGDIIDEVRSYTALRGVKVEGDRFLLNGRPYYLRMVLDQGYWRDSLTTAPSPDAHRRDIELIKSAGFNGVRKHQKIEDPNFLYWADRLGLLVWTEMPSAYRFTHESVERLTREWIDVIDRDLNHPSVVTWVPFNESWGVPDLADLKVHQSCVDSIYHLTRTLDPTRPVIGNDGWESTATDMIGIHDYDSSPERIEKKYDIQRDPEEILRQRRPGGRMLSIRGYAHEGLPIILSEFGGIGYVTAGGGFEAGWGYTLSDGQEDFQRKYEGLLEVINRIELFAGFCYTQFTDVFQERNGLFTMEREPKFPIDRIRAATVGAGNPRGEIYAVPSPLADFPEGPMHDV